MDHYRYDKTGIYLTDLGEELKFSNRYACTGYQYASMICSADHTSCVTFKTDVIEHLDAYDNGYDLFDDVLKIKHSISGNGVIAGEYVSYLARNLGDVYNDDVAENIQEYQYFSYQKLNENLEPVGQNRVDDRWKVTQKKGEEFFIARTDANQTSALEAKQICAVLNYNGKTWRLPYQDEKSEIEAFQNQYGIAGSFWNVTYDVDLYWTGFGVDKPSSNAYCIVNDALTYTIKSNLNLDKSITYESDLGDVVDFNSAGDKWYRIVMPTEGKILITLDSQGLDAVTGLYNGNLIKIASGYNYVESLEAGEYFLRVKHIDSFYTTDITVLLPSFASSGITIKEIGNGIYPDINVSKIYKFSVGQKGYVNIGASRSHSEGLSIFDSNLNHIGQKKYGNTTRYSYYQEELEIGDYYIIVKPFLNSHIVMTILSNVINSGIVNFEEMNSGVYDITDVKLLNINMQKSGYLDVSLHGSMKQFIPFDSNFKEISGELINGFSTGVKGYNFNLNSAEYKILVVPTRRTNTDYFEVTMALNSPELNNGLFLSKNVKTEVINDVIGINYYDFNVSIDSTIEVIANGSSSGLDDMGLYTSDMKRIPLSHGGLSSLSINENISAGNYVLKIAQDKDFSPKSITINGL